MTNQKSTRKALLSSVLSLLLCLTMLIGTTFAWFTDSVTSAGNIIKSGKLEATLEYKKDFAGTTWTDASTKAIFDYQNWEPGYVDAKYIKVANVGSLAFKYSLSIMQEDVVATNPNLADVIDVYVFEQGVEITRDVVSAATPVGTLSDLMNELNGISKGILLPEEGKGSSDVKLNPEDAEIAKEGSVEVGIALKMQESAGNEYQELSVGEGFTVKLLATQYTWENDSFDNTYDAGLEPVEEGEVIKEEDGIQYVYTDDGEVILYLVTPEYDNDTVNVPEGVTEVGNFSFAYNSNVKTVNLSSTVRNIDRAFDTSSVEVVNLNEGLETIGDRAFRKTPNLKTVTIPSSVTTIVDNAFQQSGITEIVVPASVTSIGFAAFGYCPNLKSITIEGNPVIANYAARGCASLETVTLLGENVTFGGTSMAFSNAESGKSDKITIYVMNQTVADAVEVANGSCTGYTVELLTVANDTASFKSAISAGGYIVVDGNVTVDSIGSGNAGVSAEATIVGGTISRESGNGNPLHVSTTEPVVFKNVEFETVKGGVVLATRTNGANITVKDSTFNNLAAPSTGNVAIQVYANHVTMTFDNCTFNNMPIITNSSYPEGIKLVFNNCTFTWTGANCPGMIQLENSVVADLDFNNCKYIYDAPLTSKSVNDFVATNVNVGAGTTIDFNGFEMVGTAMEGKIWSVVSKGGASTGKNVAVTLTGTSSYIFNGNAVDINEYLFK